MKKKNAFAGIEMLLALLIIALLFLFFTGNLFKSNKEYANGTTGNTQVTQNDVNKKIEELQNQRNELREEEQRRLRNLNNY